LPTSDTLQVPSNLAGSARADPETREPTLRASTATAFFIMDVFLSSMMPVLPGFPVDLIWVD
jgi:hypothetical protein